MTTFPEYFLWGAATAGHQIEGNNVNSDWWAREQQMPGMELSGDACDSYHRYAEDIQLLADAGLTSYRFSLEWARIEPIRGHFSRAELAHYRRVIDACLDRGITPVVTLQHFTTPQWFAEAGGWSGPDAYPVTPWRLAYQGIMPRTKNPARRKQVEMSFLGLFNGR